MKDFFGLNMPRLGFGLMRLPRLAEHEVFRYGVCLRRF